MEKTQSNTATTILTVVSVAAVSSIATFLLTYTLAPPACNTALELPINHRDYVDKLHANGVTAMFAMGASKCFILSGNVEGPLAGRVFSVLGTAMDSEHVAAIYGEEIASFCDGRPGYAVKLRDQSRRKRQATNTNNRIPGPARENGGVGRPLNGCQNQNLVFCTDEQAEYQCDTGAGELYHANIVCNSENSFTLGLKPRCDEFEATKGDRFIKCLVKFYNGHPSVRPENTK